MRSFDAWFGRVLGALAVVGALLILVMVGVVTVDVLLRTIVRRGLAWSSEFSEYGIYVVTLLVAPWLLRNGLHVKIDMLSSRVSGAAGYWLAKFIDACGGIVCLVIAFYAWQMVRESMAAGSMVIRNVIFPEWLVMAPLPAAFLILAVEFFLGLWRGHAHRTGATLQ